MSPWGYLDPITEERVVITTGPFVNNLVFDSGPKQPRYSLLSRCRNYEVKLQLIDKYSMVCPSCGQKIMKQDFKKELDKARTEAEKELAETLGVKIEWGVYSSM